MRSIREIKQVKNKAVLVRVDFNVPINDGKVEDDFKIRKAVPTIEFLVEQGAKVVLITHIGRGDESALPAADALGKFIKVKFVPDIIGSQAREAVLAMQSGDVILLDNLRKHAGEKSCDKDFAQALAEFGQLYVNEAFPVSHREDASIVLLPKLLPAYAGFQLEEEVKNLSVAFEKPEHPFLFILGGAKFETKLPIIKKYIETADNIFIGGAMLNDFLKVKGFEVGVSLVSEGTYGIKEIYENEKLILPESLVVKTIDGDFVQKDANAVSATDNIIDLGNKAVDMIAPYIKEAKLIVWNGPLGKYEAGGGGATKKILKLVADSQAHSIIGGGDLISVLSSLEPKSYKPKPNLFISTGGGATLDFLVNGTLPGIKALE